MVKFEVQNVNLSSQQKSYPIIIGKDLLQNKELLQHYVPSKQVFLVTNKIVAPLYLKYLSTAFADRQCDVIILEDGEFYKNQNSLDEIHTSLIQNQHHRDTTIISLGGGVVGDLTGFAAATYHRGVNYIQIPTTLLAQVDASIGGKTGINRSEGKNIIGSFHQPKAVLIDLSTLNTLPQREFSAGFAEIIKYAILDGGEFFSSVDKFLSRDRSSCKNELAAIISRCCRIKANIVENDELESGQRALLNLGHTIAHALESYTEYKRWLHGETVGIGLYCAALLSQNFGLDPKIVRQIDQVLDKASLPRRIPKDIDLLSLRKMINNDKKIKNNRLRFILIKALGSCYIENGIMDDALLAMLQAAKEGE